MFLAGLRKTSALVVVCAIHCDNLHFWQARPVCEAKKNGDFRKRGECGPPRMSVISQTSNGTPKQFSPTSGRSRVLNSQT